MRWNSCAIAVVFVMSTLSAARGAQDPRNAATWYQRAINQFNRLPEDQRELLINGWDPAQGAPTESMRNALANAQAILQNFQRGSMQEYSDFDLDRSQGFELMLPHLGPLRSLVKMARTDAQVRMFDGDNSGAADRMATIYRASGHEGNDGILISSLVGQAIFSAGEGLAQQAIDRGALDAADSAKLLSAIKRLEPEDPFNYTESLAGEQDMAINWMSSKWSTPEGRQSALTLLGDLEGNPARDQLAALDDTGFQKSLDDYDSTMNRVIDAFNIKDPKAAKAALDKISAEVEAGEHGPLCMVLLPAFGRVLQKKFEAQDAIAARIAVLEKLAKGEAKPEELANAAIWYLHGIALLEQLDSRWLDIFRAGAADISKPLMPELNEALDSKQIGEILDAFRDGSMKMRCDFKSAAPQGNDIVMIPSYDPGMHDALRLFRLDAVRLLRAGNHAEVADRLALCLRIIGHMGSDPYLCSALIAHADFPKTLALIEIGLQTGIIDEQGKSVLREAMDRISRKDPFGYVAAVAATREQLIAFLRRQRTSNDQEQARRERSIAMTKELGGDHLLYLLAAIDTMQTAAKNTPLAPNAAPAPAPATQPEKSSARPQLEPAERLADVLSAHDLEAVQKELKNIAPMLARGDIDIFSGLELRVIGSVSDHMRLARGDLRRGQMLVAPPRPPKPPKPDAIDLQQK